MKKFNIVVTGLILMAVFGLFFSGVKITNAINANDLLPDYTLGDLSRSSTGYGFRVYNTGGNRGVTASSVEVEYRWHNQDDTETEPCLTGRSRNGELPRITAPAAAGYTDAHLLAERNNNWWSCPFGLIPDRAIWLKITINPRHLILENNFNNNIATINRPFPNLKIEPGEFDWDNKTFWFKIRNTGETLFEQPIEVSYRWLDANNNPVSEYCHSSSTLLSGLTVLPFEMIGERMTGPNDYGRVTINKNSLPGGCPFSDVLLGSYKKLRVWIDPANRIMESSKTDNTIYFARPLSDLTVNEAYFPARTHFRFKIKEHGLKIAHGDVRVQFSWMDMDGHHHLGTSYSIRVPHLGENNSRTTVVDSNNYPGLKSFISRPPAGATHFMTFVNYDNDIPEMDSTNNYYTIPI